MYRRPAEESVDLYPGLVVHDGRVTGSITASASRLPLWAFAGWDWSDVLAGWDYIETEYGWTRERHAGFLRDLLNVRGEFARLLLVLADAERREQEREDEVTEPHGPIVRISLQDGDGGVKLPPPWYEDDNLKQPVIDQLKRCLALLETDE
jgi:hypothetical protein